MNRRGFLFGLGASAVAPVAVARAAPTSPARPLIAHGFKAFTEYGAVGAPLEEILATHQSMMAQAAIELFVSPGPSSEAVLLHMHFTAEHLDESDLDELYRETVEQTGLRPATESRFAGRKGRA